MDRKSRPFIRWAVVMLLVVVSIVPASAQYGSRGDKRYRDRYSRTNTYGDVVELRLNNPGTLEEKMPPDMIDKVRLLHIEGPMDSKDFEFIKKRLCNRSSCVDNRDRKVDNFIDLELEHARIMSAGTKGLFGYSGERDVLGDALSYSNHLRSIVLPERTKRIANGALRGCSELEEVIMPPSVRSLGDNAFDGCYRLEYVTLYEGLESIGEECFEDCSNLRTVNLPRTLAEIGKKAFKGTALQHVTLPYGLTTLGAEAFAGTPLVLLDLPASTRIEDNNLGTMKKLEEITVENGSRYYTCEDGVLYDNTGRVLLLCPSARTGSYRVPDDVECIGPRAFSNSRLSFVAVPASVVEIGETAFYECSHLQQIELPGVRNMGKRAFGECKALESVVANRLNALPASAFENCSALKRVELSPEANIIGEHAFKHCKSLSYIELPEQLTTIGKEAFEGCALSSLELPEGVVVIGERAFKNNRGLTRVALPDACARVEKEAFRECVSLSEIDLGRGLLSLGDNALRETAITRLVIPESVTDVGKKVAEKCKNLTCIECHAVLPPKLDGVSNNKVELRVPDTSLPAYKSAKNWKNFKNILPLQ